MVQLLGNQTFELKLLCSFLHPLVANRKTLSGGPDGIISQSATPPILPRGCRPLSHQVAGHRYGQGRLGIGNANVFYFCTLDVTV